MEELYCGKKIKMESTQNKGLSVGSVLGGVALVAILAGGIYIGVKVLMPKKYTALLKPDGEGYIFSDITENGKSISSGRSATYMISQGKTPNVRSGNMTIYNNLNGNSLFLSVEVNGKEMARSATIQIKTEKK